MRRLSILGFAVVAGTGLLGPGSASATPELAGQLMSSTPLAAAVTPPGAVNAKRIVYRTIGVADAPALSSGAIYFPPGTPPPGGWPIIAWAHGTVGLADHCAYSIGGPIMRDRDWAYLDAWLRQGYAIVATDYVGLGTPGNHPYLNGIVEAHSVVDAVKAATRAYPGTLAKRWVVIGQSQGGGAAVITARHATEFDGGELDYRGAVATGVPAHVEDVVVHMGPHVPPVSIGPNLTVYGLYLLSGLRTSFPNLRIDSFLTPAGHHWVDRAEQLCDPELGRETEANNVVLGDMLAKPLDSIPDAHAVLAGYLGIPESGYDHPLFIGQGLLDTDVFVPGTLATVAAMRANRQPVTFQAYPADHGATVNASLPDTIPFVQTIMTR